MSELADSVWDFNRKICEVLGLDVDRIVSYTIVGDSDGVTIHAEIIGDIDGERLNGWKQKYRLVEDGEREPIEEPGHHG